MTKSKFIAIHTRRGYEVADLGKIVTLHMDNYSAMWFFNSDGTLDTNNKPTWKITRQGDFFIDNHRRASDQAGAKNPLYHTAALFVKHFLEKKQFFIFPKTLDYF